MISSRSCNRPPHVYILYLACQVFYTFLECSTAHSQRLSSKNLEQVPLLQLSTVETLEFLNRWVPEDCPPNCQCVNPGQGLLPTLGSEKRLLRTGNFSLEDFLYDPDSQLIHQPPVPRFSSRRPLCRKGTLILFLEYTPFPLHSCLLWGERQFRDEDKHKMVRDLKPSQAFRLRPVIS